MNTIYQVLTVICEVVAIGLMAWVEYDMQVGMPRRKAEAERQKQQAIERMRAYE